MPRSNYDDDNDYRSGHSSRRNRSPDYYSGAGGGPAVGFGDPGRPFRDDEPFEREEMTLMPPAQNYGRANSVPPGNALAYRDGSQSPYERSRGGHSRRSHSRSAYDDDDGESRRDHRRSSPSPMSRARSTMEDNFSNSSAGIGAGILGAVVGGLVANKATDAAYNRGGKGGHQHHHNDDHAVPKAVSTILGAVAGGLGANAFAHHVEGEREKRRERERPLRSQNDDGDYYRRRSHSRRDDDYEDHDDRRRDDHRRYRD